MDLDRYAREGREIAKQPTEAVTDTDIQQQ
jgi:hypothetical protein